MIMQATDLKINQIRATAITQIGQTLCVAVLKTTQTTNSSRGNIGTNQPDPSQLI